MIDYIEKSLQHFNTSSYTSKNVCLLSRADKSEQKRSNLFYVKLACRDEKTEYHKSESDREMNRKRVKRSKRFEQKNKSQSW